MNLCANRGILLWNLCPAGKGYEADLYRKDFFLLKPLARKCRTRVRIVQKAGLPFFLFRNRKRKMFAAGFVLMAASVFLLSCFVWNISIEGNFSVSRQSVMEYLADRDIGYGTWKKNVDCRQLAADLRNAFPDLIWVSVRLRGTYLSIDVQENTDLPDREPTGDESAGANDPSAADGGGTDLIADKGGIIVRMITRQGLPVVGEGDTVKPGDLLVKGEMEITDDDGNVAAYRYAASDADVYVKSELTYRDVFPLAHEVMEYTGERRYGFYVNLFGKCFGINPGVDAFPEADVLCRERQLCLFDDFYLPFSAALVQAREYVTTVETYTKEEAQAIASAKFQKFLSENEEKGVQIFENNVKIDVSADSCRSYGTATAVQKTGRSVRTRKSDLSRKGTDA